MILADTSIWIDHFRAHDLMLAHVLERNEVLIHPFVLGEISLGNFGDRKRKLVMLAKLPLATLASAAEVARAIEDNRLHGLGVGYIDVHLAVSTMLTRDARLWTRDRRLRSVAEQLGVAAMLSH